MSDPERPGPFGDNERLCAVSVDLDSLRCYYAIHGLGEVPVSLTDVVLRRGLPRFAEVFGRHGIKATFFLSGASMAAFAPAATAGHELGAHTVRHPCNAQLRALSLGDMAKELDESRTSVTALGQAGKVSFAGRYRSYGQIVIIEHGNGWNTLLTNLDAVQVAKGATVRQGDVLGTSGGGATEIGVELRKNGRVMDIAALLW